jgi:type II secretory pathway component PulF
MPDELERAILKEIIKISIPKKQRVVAAYFMDQITDAGALARKHNLSSEAEAMSVIIDAGVNLTQIINALKKYIDKAFDKPKNFWATQFRDVIIKTKDSDMSAQADKG